MRDFTVLTWGRLGSAVVQMAMIVALGSYASPDTLGLALSVLGISTLAASLSDLGLSTTALRAWARGDSDTALAAASTSNLLGLAVGGVGLAGALVLAVLDNRLWPVVPLIVWALAERQTETWLTIALGEGKARRVGWLVLARRLLAGSVMAVLVAVGVDPAWAFSCALASAAVLFWCVTVRRPPGLVSLPSAIDEIRRSWPIGVSVVAGQARNLDTAIVAAALGSGAAAAFGLGVRTGASGMIAFSNVGALLLANHVRLGPRRLKRVAWIILGCSLVLALVAASSAPAIYVVLPPLIPWLTVEDASVLALALSAYMLVGGNTVLGPLGNALGIDRLGGYLSIATVLAYLGALALLSTAAGLKIAVVAAAATQLVSLVIRVALVHVKGEGREGLWRA